jgi:two-component system chemotaxis response regulator CheY
VQHTTYQVPPRPLSILVVDEARETARIVRRVLDAREADVLSAASDAEATSLLLRQHVDLVIVCAPPCSALRLVSAVRASPRKWHASMPIVVLASEHHETLIDAAFEVGVTYLLRAPLTELALAKIVRSPDFARVPDPSTRAVCNDDLERSEAPTWRPSAPSIEVSPASGEGGAPCSKNG